MDSQKAISILKGLRSAHEAVHRRHAAYMNAVALVMTLEIPDLRIVSRYAEAMDNLTESTRAIGLSPEQYLRGNMFFAQIAGTELFFQGVIRSVVSVHPKKVGGIQFKLSDIVDASSIDEVIDKAINQYLNGLMYKKPLEYLEDLASLLSIDKQMLLPFWPGFVESKARRDIGIHNDWICNDTYLRKVREVGIESEYKLGDLIIPADHKYFIDCSTNQWNLAMAISDHVLAWMTPETPNTPTKTSASQA